jgi:hypothetical protein
MDPSTDNTSLVLSILHEQWQALRDRSSQLTNATLKLDELQKRPRMTLLQQAELRVYERVCKAIEDAKLPLCEGKDTTECVEAMIARTRELEARLGEKVTELAEVVPYAQRRSETLKRLFAALEFSSGDYDREGDVQSAEREIRRLWKATRECYAIERKYASESNRTGLYREFVMELRDVLQVPSVPGIELPVELDQLLEAVKQQAKDHGEAITTIQRLEKQLAEQAPKVKEWLDAIDALAEAWPRDVPCKDNPTHAEWIRDLVAVLGEKAKQQMAEALGKVRERIEAMPGRDEISDDLNGAKWVYREDAIKIIDELAGAGQSNTAQPQ